MSIDHPEDELLGILEELRKLSHETEWAEFKPFPYTQVPIMADCHGTTTLIGVPHR